MLVAEQDGVLVARREVPIPGMAGEGLVRVIVVP
jgi:hypothetical protein